MMLGGEDCRHEDLLSMKLIFGFVKALSKTSRVARETAGGSAERGLFDTATC